MKLDQERIVKGINKLADIGCRISIVNLSGVTGYTYPELQQSEYGFLTNGWTLFKRRKLIWLDNEKLGLSTKVRVERLHNGGFWFIHQKDEKHPFMTCNPAYLKIYGHLFISCVFVKVQ